jgi:hypothetical protein
MVAAVEGREQTVEVLRVAYHTVEINYRVEVASRTNPRIHRLSISLAQRTWMVII